MIYLKNVSYADTLLWIKVPMYKMIKTHNILMKVKNININSNSKFGVFDVFDRLWRDPEEIFFPI